MIKWKVEGVKKVGQLVSWKGKAKSEIQSQGLKILRHAQDDNRFYIHLGSNKPVILNLVKNLSFSFS